MRYHFDQIPLTYNNESFEYAKFNMVEFGFNSGMMYYGTNKFLNLKYYNEFKQFITEYVSDNSNVLTCFDQEFLNQFFYRNYKEYVTWLPPFYNVCIFKETWFTDVGPNFLTNNLDDKCIELLDNAKIIHYLNKYDDLDKDLIVRKYYDKYLNMNNDTFKQINKLNVAICVSCKVENNYIREFIQHYLNLGFSKVIILDNNDFNYEYIGDVIKDYRGS